MKNQHYLCRLPFRSGDGSLRYRVMWEMTNDPDVEIRANFPFVWTVLASLVGQSLFMVRWPGNVSSAVPYFLWSKRGQMALAKENRGQTTFLLKLKNLSEKYDDIIL